MQANSLSALDADQSQLKRPVLKQLPQEPRLPEAPAKPDEAAGIQKPIQPQLPGAADSFQPQVRPLEVVEVVEQKSLPPVQQAESRKEEVQLTRMEQIGRGDTKQSEMNSTSGFQSSAVPQHEQKGMEQMQAQNSIEQRPIE